MPITKATANIIKTNVNIGRQLFLTTPSPIATTNKQMFATGIVNGRRSYANTEGFDYQIVYSGTRWEIIKESSEEGPYVVPATNGTQTNPWDAVWPSGNSVTLGSEVQNSNAFIGESTMRDPSEIVAWAGGNTSHGTNALVNLSTTPEYAQANSNTAIGANCLQSVVIGHSNTAVGAGALQSTTFSQNTAVGASALSSCNDGTNTAIGWGALRSLVTGSQNTALGWNALPLNNNITNSTGVGASALVTASNQVQLGNSATTTFAFGAVQNRSDERDKTEIKDTELGLDFVKALRPVDFKWDMREDYRPEPPVSPSENATEEEKAAYETAKAKWLEDVKLANINSDGSKKRNRFHHGLIAQEVKAVLDAKGIDFGGFQDHKIAGGDDVLSIGYGELIAPMIKAIQELSAEVASLKAQLNP